MDLSDDVLMMRLGSGALWKAQRRVPFPSPGPGGTRCPPDITGDIHLPHMAKWCIPPSPLWSCGFYPTLCPLKANPKLILRGAGEKK